MLVLDSATGGASTARLFCVYRAPPDAPTDVCAVFTHVLGHSGYSHYMSNMPLLLLVGPGLEEKYGSRNLLLRHVVIYRRCHCELVRFTAVSRSTALGPRHGGSR